MDPSIKRKLAGGTIGLGAAVSLILAYVDQRVSAVEKSLEEKNASVYRMIDVRHGDVKSGLDNIQKKLDTIDERVYNIQKYLKE